MQAEDRSRTAYIGVEFADRARERKPNVGCGAQRTADKRRAPDAGEPTVEVAQVERVACYADPVDDARRLRNHHAGMRGIAPAEIEGQHRVA